MAFMDANKQFLQTFKNKKMENKKNIFGNAISMKDMIKKAKEGKKEGTVNFLDTSSCVAEFLGTKLKLFKTNPSSTIAGNNC